MCVDQIVVVSEKVGVKRANTRKISGFLHISGSFQSDFLRLDKLLSNLTRHQRSSIKSNSNLIYTISPHFLVVAMIFFSFRSKYRKVPQLGLHQVVLEEEVRKGRESVCLSVCCVYSFFSLERVGSKQTQTGLIKRNLSVPRLTLSSSCYGMMSFIGPYKYCLLHKGRYRQKKCDSLQGNYGQREK